jgi:hypothetical protein
MRFPMVQALFIATQALDFNFTLHDLITVQDLFKDEEEVDWTR